MLCDFYYPGSPSRREAAPSSEFSFLVCRCGRCHQAEFFVRLAGIASIMTMVTAARWVLSPRLSRCVHRSAVPCLPIVAFPTGRSPRSSFLSSAARRNDINTRTPFLLADIGEGIKEVEVLQWFVRPGDVVRQFDKICEVQSDKATVEITSRYDGEIVELNGEAGEMIQVGTPLLYMLSSEGAGTDPTEVSSTMETTHVSIEDESTRRDTEREETPVFFHPVDNKILASPAVRKMGREYGIDLSSLAATGPGGRLLKSDVLSHLQATDRLPSSEATTSDPYGSVAPISLPSIDDTDIIKLKGYSRLMVQSMTDALQIPHMCFGDEVEVGKLMDCRSDLKAMGSNISLLSLMIKACSLAMLEYPHVNACVHDAAAGELRLLSSHNIGVAMDTPRGLVVPAIRGCERLTVQEIQNELDRLKEAAKDSKLQPCDLEGTSFTLSNIGSIGGTYMKPVIVPPQLAMGAIGQIQRLPRFDENDQVYAARVVTVSWAGDHRFLDGATLARFSQTFKRLIENPITMLTNLR